MIRTLRMPTQIWIPSPRRGNENRPPTPERVPPGAQPDRNDLKPDGGLWTSTYSTHTEIGWWEWCAAEQPGWLADHGYLLYPQECRVWVIADAEDHHEFHERYARPVRPDTYFHTYGDHILLCSIDWPAVVRDCDALWLKRRWRTFDYDAVLGPPRWAHVITFYGWDCESTWWSRWLFRGRARRVLLPKIYCETCLGDGWEERPDMATMLTGEVSGVECPTCGGSGRK